MAKRVGWDCRPGDVIELPGVGNRRVVNTSPNYVRVADKDGNLELLSYDLLWQNGVCYVAEVVVALPEMRF